MEHPLLASKIGKRLRKDKKNWTGAPKSQESLLFYGIAEGFAISLSLYSQLSNSAGFRKYLTIFCKVFNPYFNILLVLAESVFRYALYTRL